MNVTGRSPSSQTTSQTETIRSPRVVFFIAGLFLSAFLLYLALREIDLKAVGDFVASANGLMLLLALLSVTANTLGKAFRWKELLGPGREQVSFGNCLSVLLIGQMLNTLLPARVGELSRAYMVGGLGPGRSYTLGTVILEKLIDLLAYALLFCLLVLLIPLPDWLDRSIVPFFGVLALAVCAVLLCVYKPGLVRRAAELGLRPFPARITNYLLPRFEAGLECLMVLRGRPAVLKLSLWTALIWGTAVLTNHLVLLALGLRLPWAASILILVVLQVGISIPAGPGRIGVFEWICILSLAVFGIDRQLSLGYGLVLHALVLLPTTLLGVLFFWAYSLRGRRILFTGS